MLEKTKEKEKRKKRPTWNGLYTRKTPTKKDKLEKELRKVKQKHKDE